jgi:hypothetical protein
MSGLTVINIGNGKLMNWGNVVLMAALKAAGTGEFPIMTTLLEVSECDEQINFTLKQIRENNGQLQTLNAELARLKEIRKQLLLSIGVVIGDYPYRR